MRLRLAHARWCIGIIIMVVLNVHISLWVRRVYDKSSSTDFHPLYSDLAQQFAKRNGNHSSTQDGPVSESSGMGTYVWVPAGSNLTLPTADLAESTFTPTIQNITREDPVVITIIKYVNVTEDSPRRYLPKPILPADFLLEKTLLPSFAADETEFLLNSMIERSAQSTDLYLTTFMLCHYVLRPVISNTAVKKVHPIMKDTWLRATVKFQAARYYESGSRKQEREDEKFYCTISHSENSVSYTVPGVFMPNRLTSDPNANRLIDMLRCPIQDSLSAFHEFAHTNESISVHIIKGNKSIAAFSVPWLTRKTGFLMSNSRAASQIDAWKGHEMTMGDKPSTVAVDKLHIIVPCSSQEPVRIILPMYFEFVSHHLLLGAAHIHLPVPFSWNSPQMNRFTELFQTYIQEGKVTLSSQSADGIDTIRSMSGMSFHKHSMKVMQINSCLFYAKGMAEYVFILDLDEFFIPKGKNFNFLDVFNTIAPKEDLLEYAPLGDKVISVWREKAKSGGHGWASGHAHPSCYISVFSDVMVNPVKGGYFDMDRPWVGQRFAHSVEKENREGLRSFFYTKAILPTESTFQSSINTGGGCRLPMQWTSCLRPIRGVVTNPYSVCSNIVNVPKRFELVPGTPSTRHDFDELVTKDDSYLMNKESEGSVLHYLTNRDDYGASEEALKNSSTYTDRYFNNVLNDLQERGLELMMRIKDKGPEIGLPTAEDKWDFLYSPDDVKKAEPYADKPVESSFDFHLPNNFSRRQEEYEVKLPNFAVDYTDYALGAMIERVSDSFELYTTIFFLCHTLLEPKIGSSAQSGEAMSSEVYDVWKRAMTHFESTQYTANGMRKTPPAFYCNISHAEGGPYYLVEGIFIPNKLTPDSNANKRLDILRCKMEDTQAAYMNHARTSDEMRVEVLRGNFSLIRFRIPWKSRKTGFMLSEPPNLVTTVLDAWKGFDRNNIGKWTHDRLYMCVPGWEDKPSKISLPIFMEWIQHHLLLGVSHIFTGTLFGWDSHHMATILKAVGSFIEDGSLTVTSHAGDNLDGAYSTGGLSWGRDNIKNFHVNMCLYYSKGSADYVGVWDFDEFFQPRGQNKNLLDVIDAVEPAKDAVPFQHEPNKTSLEVYAGWKPARGMADKDGHPFCYLVLNSEVTLVSQRVAPNTPPSLRVDPWIGQIFAHGHEPFGHGMGFKKSIRPTRTIFQGGLHLAGACRLPSGWNGCGHNETEFCYHHKRPFSRLQFDADKKVVDFHLDHYFDEIVLDTDAKFIDSKGEGVLNHIQYRRMHHQASPGAIATKGEYTTSYFPAVYEALERRGLVMPFELPETSAKPFPNPDVTWLDHVVLNTKISEAKEKSKTQSHVWLDPDNLNSPLSQISLKDIMKANSSSSASASASSSTTTSTSTSRRLAEVVMEPEVKPENRTKSSPEAFVDYLEDSQETNEDYAALPAFSADKSEMFLGSMVEREDDSWNLHITTFLMNHGVTRPDKTRRTCHNVRSDKDTLKSWAQHIMYKDDVSYEESGARGPNIKYYCKIRATSADQFYTVEGEFMPNKLTPDPNANKIMDIMRCKMEKSEKAYMELARSEHEITVEILREKESLITFVVPWKTRVQSRYLSRPGDESGADTPTGSSKNPWASKFDPWMGFNKTTPGEWKREKLFMCVPGMETAPSRKYLAVYLEFIQHHLLMGASHIFLSAPFAWGGPIMTKYLRILRTFIEDGSVSMTSHADDGKDFLYSVRGLSMMRDNLKIFQVNFCTYYSKGVSDYVAIWDFDEFFIPRGKNKNLIDLVDSTHAPAPLDIEIANTYAKANTNNELWKGGPGPGWASGNGHPYCFIQIFSEVVANKDATETVDMNHLWIGERFAHSSEPYNSRLHGQFGFRKSIIPTKTMFQMGLHMSGACHLPYPFSGCPQNATGFCYERAHPDEDVILYGAEKNKFYNTHSFIDKVRGADVKDVDMANEGVLHHILLNRYYQAVSNETDLSTQNEYASKHFPNVMKALRKRKLDLLLEIPEKAVRTPNIYDAWLTYELIYFTRNTLGNLFPSYDKKMST